MESLIFLAVAAVIVAIGLAVMWVRDRAESRFDSGIDRFRSEMGALAPARVPRTRRRSRSVRS
jgi:hypothetical protein